MITHRRLLMPLRPRAEAGVTFTDPTDIAGLCLWFDFSDADTLYTDAGSTKVTADGDAIYQVNDKSGGGINGVQATANMRPLYKTNIKNSLSVALVDNSNDMFGYAYPLGVATDFTVWFVGMSSGYTNYTTFFGKYAAPANIWGTPVAHCASDRTIYAGTDVTNRVVTSAGYVANGTYYSLMLSKSGTAAANLLLTKNGGSSATNAGKTASNPSSANMCIGDGPLIADAALNGYICEFIIYNSALSSANMSAVEGYLNDKWGLY